MRRDAHGQRDELGQEVGRTGSRPPPEGVVGIISDQCALAQSPVGYELSRSGMGIFPHELD